MSLADTARRAASLVLKDGSILERDLAASLILGEFEAVLAPSPDPVEQIRRALAALQGISRAAWETDGETLREVEGELRYLSDQIRARREPRLKRKGPVLVRIADDRFLDDAVDLFRAIDDEAAS